MRVHVSVHVGSLMDPALGAHAIVNASNPHVGLGSGVSGAIREACGGHSFQKEVRGAWEAEFDEPLQPGDYLVTSAGTATAFRWVLHVPAVDYKVRDPARSVGRTTDLIEEAVARCGAAQRDAVLADPSPLRRAGEQLLAASLTTEKFLQLCPKMTQKSMLGRIA
jgi:hypothetical protein